MNDDRVCGGSRRAGWVESQFARIGCDPVRIEQVTPPRHFVVVIGPSWRMVCLGQDRMAVADEPGWRDVDQRSGRLGTAAVKVYADSRCQLATGERSEGLSRCDTV